MSNREQRRASRNWFNKGKKHAVENRISDLDYILKNILSYYPNNLTCLDVGCAEGDMLDYFSKRFSRVVGLEKYDSLFNVASAKFADAVNIEVVRGDILMDKIDEYDFTFCLGVLHYYDLESEKLTVLRNVLSNTRCFSFFRTAFYENKIYSENNSAKVLKKATKIKTISQAAWECGFRWMFFDNNYRGQGGRRLGDLVVFQRINGVDTNLDAVLLSRQ